MPRVSDVKGGFCSEFNLMIKIFKCPGMGGATRRDAMRCDVSVLNLIWMNLQEERGQGYIG